MRLPLLTALLASLPLFVAHAEFILKENDVLAVCGDSITNMKEYPAYIEDYLIMCQPVPGIRVGQYGISGEKASGLLSRMDFAVLPFKPTVVSICYGMNDGKYIAPDPQIATDYGANLTKVIDTFKATGVRTGVVASPGAVDEFYRKEKPPYNATLAGLRDVAQEVARKEGFAFADLHSLMEATMKAAKAEYGEDYSFAGGDGVHPVPTGHLSMAYGILKAMGCDGAIGTFTVDLAAKKAEASPDHRVLSFESGKLELESSRYPFCFSQPGAPSNLKKELEGILPFLPFNQDLNRFVLVVHGLNGKSTKITWGRESKTFKSEDLEKGVNLAAHFFDNPFSEKFYAIHKAVRAQQSAGGKEMREIMHPLMKEADKAKVTQIQEETVAASNKRSDAVSAMMEPLKHTISIEVEP